MVNVNPPKYRLVAGLDLIKVFIQKILFLYGSCKCLFTGTSVKTPSIEA